ncbi:MAG: hypothetical protein V7646_5401 [Pseudonocardia sp.]|jgi:hypothetical protein
MCASRKSRLPILTLLVCLSALGCNNGPDPDAESNPGGQSATEGRPAKPPDKQKSKGKAIGAPIKIPPVTERQGEPLIDVTADIDEAIRKQCGNGELCVQLHFKEDDNTSSIPKCSFVRIEPGPGTVVDRGTRVSIVHGTEPCDVEPPDSP